MGHARPGSVRLPSHLGKAQSLDFLSYKNSNEANRGNEYPSGDETSITLTGLTKGQDLQVQARTRYTSGGDNDGAWSGPWTDTVTARVKDDLPTAPTGLTTLGVAHDSVTISWAAPSQGTVTSYRVMRGTEIGSLSTIEEDTGNIDVEYTDSTVAAETTYYYAVLALSQDGDGAQSTTVSATTPAEAQPVPSAPTGLTTSGVAHDSVTLTWTAPSSGSTIAGYRVSYGAADANSLSTIAQDTGNTTVEYTDTTVAAETTYHYAVLALSQDGDGAQSANDQRHHSGGTAASSVGAHGARSDPLSRPSEPLVGRPAEQQHHGLPDLARSGRDQPGEHPTPTPAARRPPTWTTPSRLRPPTTTRSAPSIRPEPATSPQRSQPPRQPPLRKKSRKSQPKGTPVPNRVTRADPTVPLNLAVVPGDAQLTYTWDPPTNTGGSPIIRYNYAFGPEWRNTSRR